jgi:tyrosyl-tRNA synthetase
MTSPYSFYQFWLNVSDEDAEKFIKIFTFLDRPNIESLIEEHRQDPGRRVLQKRLAEEVTVMVHSQEDLDTAIKASSILFGKGTKETLQSLSLRDLLSVFEGVPQFNIGKAQITDSISVIDFLTDVTGVFASKSEVRRAINGNALSINSEKVTNDTETISSRDLINDSLVWVQNGKKNNYLVLVG